MVIVADTAREEEIDHLQEAVLNKSNRNRISNGISNVVFSIHERKRSRNKKQ